MSFNVCLILNVKTIMTIKLRNRMRQKHKYKYRVFNNDKITTYVIILGLVVFDVPLVFMDLSFFSIKLCKPSLTKC